MKFTPTIPNFLTLFRVVLILPMLYFIWSGGIWGLVWALVIFGVSALTDTFDGILARKLNQMSEFGAYFDPLADKILVIALYTVFCFRPELHIAWWMVLLILVRDLAVTQLRNYASRKNLPFKTSLLAKAKTTVQMVSGFMIMVYLLILEILARQSSLAVSQPASVWNTNLSGSGWLEWLPAGLTIAVVLFTLMTGLDYFFTMTRKKGA